MPGRLTECSVPGCRSTTHRADKCPLQKRDKAPQPAGLQHPRQAYADAPKGWKNRAQAVELLEKELQSNQNNHEWQRAKGHRTSRTIRQDLGALRLKIRFTLLDEEGEDTDENNLINDSTISPIKSSTPKTPGHRTLQRQSKEMAKYLNTLIMSTQRKSGKSSKGLGVARRADGGKAGQRASPRPRKRRKKIQQENSSGEPHQRESGSESGSDDGQSDHGQTERQPPQPVPEAGLDPHPDPMSDEGRGQGPGGGGPVPPGGCLGAGGGQSDISKNIQNTIFVHNDSSHSNSL